MAWVSPRVNTAEPGRGKTEFGINLADIGQPLPSARLDSDDQVRSTFFLTPPRMITSLGSGQVPAST